MKKSDYFLLLDEMLESDPGTIKSGMLLADIPNWDSLAVMGLIALLDEKFAISVPATQINACRTVDDLAGLTGGKVTD